LAAAIDEVAGDPVRAAEYGRAGRERVIAEFSWTRIARQTLDVYEDVLNRR